MDERTSNVSGAEKKKRVKRSWSLAEKLRIVEASNAPGAQVSETARSFGVASALLFHWRRLAREGKLAASGGGFAIAKIVPAPSEEEVAGEAPLRGPRAPGAIEISVAGARIFVDANVETAALARVLAALKRSAHPSDAGASETAR